jgi:putative ABC transport system substrate-binding protein
MQRREFIKLIGGAAAAWPLAARAQQSDRMRRIGVLMNLAADDSESPVRFAAFAQGLQELGWIVGGIVRIDIRWGASDPDRSRSFQYPNPFSMLACQLLPSADMVGKESDQ